MYIIKGYIDFIYNVYVLYKSVYMVYRVGNDD